MIDNILSGNHIYMEKRLDNTDQHEEKKWKKLRNLQEVTADVLADCLATNEIAKKIVEFVIKQHWDEFISLPKMRTCINEVFFKQLPIQNEAEAKQYMDALKDLDFFDINNYAVPYNEHLYNFMNNLSSFRDELSIYIDIKFNVNKDRHLYKLVRQVSPPLEAYDYIWHSKLDIKDTKKAFGIRD